jgi:hypothetical protein
MVARVHVGTSWDSAYADVLELISAAQPSLVIGLQDGAIPLCSKLSTVVPGVVAPPLDAAIAALDKAQFARLADAHFPDLYPAPDAWPQVYKPITGFGSRGVTRVEYPRIVPADMIAQRFIYGPEYTVDAVFDHANHMLDCVPRLRTRVADGEVISSSTVRDSALADATARIGHALRLVGPACVQFRRDADGLWVLEANARFGGGSVLSMAAGFDMLGLCEQLFAGQPCTYVPGSWKHLNMHRYLTEYYYE